MNVSILALHCLNALCDDYENVSSIKDEVHRSTHRKVSEYDIGLCLIDLTKRGLIEVFAFHPSQSRYIRVDEWLGNWKDKWFAITDKGRAELDLKWFED